MTSRNRWKTGGWRLVLAMAFVQTGVITGLAGEGTLGSDFLFLQFGARPAAMGGAYSAYGGDAESMHYSPTGILQLVNPQIYASHLSWWEDITLDSVWGVQPLGKDRALGVGVSYLQIPAFNSTEDPSAPMVGAWGLIASGSYAFALDRSMDLGFSLKAVLNRLADAQSLGAAVDAAVTQRYLNDQLRLILALRHLGFFSAFESTADLPPMQASLGVAYQWWPDEPERVALAMEATAPIAGTPVFALGLEGWLFNLIALRAGLDTAADAGDRFSVGAGVRFSQFHVDYAFTPSEVFAPVHRISLGYDLGSQRVLPRPRLSVKTATKQVVQPGGDVGFEVDFMPQAEAPAGVNFWTVDILDRAGKRLRRLAGQESMPLRIVWDGLDENGARQDPEAYHRYLVELEDKRGYRARVTGEILPISITSLPRLQAAPRDLFTNRVTFVPMQKDIQEWTIRIVAEDGTLLRRYQGMGAIPKDFAWDGRDEDNRMVAMKEGVGFIMQVRDAEGNEVRTQAPFVQVDAGTKVRAVVPVQLPEQITFHVNLADNVRLNRWALDITCADTGEVVRRLSGEGNPPESLVWDCRDEQGQAVRSDCTFQYVLTLQDVLGNAWQQAAELGSTEVKVLSVTEQETAVKVEQILFDFNRAELKPAMFEKLRKVADLVRAAPEGLVQVTVEGHTDEVGTDEYNLQLSLNRANMVMRFLVEEEGLPSSRFQTKGYGKTQPYSNLGSTEARALNRRVEVTIHFLK